MAGKPTHEALEKGPKGLRGDILEGEYVQAGLHITRGKLQQLLSFSPVIAYTCRTGGEYAATFVSQNVQGLLGYGPQEFVNDPKFWANHIHHEDRPRVLDALSRLVEDGLRSIEYRFQYNDGAYRWMRDEFQLVLDGEGRPVEMAGFWIDIDDRKQAEIELQKAHNELEERVKERTEKLSKANEELKAKNMAHKQAVDALRESEERFRTLVESTSDWVWEVDPEGIYTYVSPKVKDMLGYGPEEIIGKSPFDLMPQAEAERIKKAFRAMVEYKSPIVRLENTNFHKDGRPVVLETSGTPFFDVNGNLQGYRGIDRDVTERKKSEEALRQSYLDLRNTQAQLVQTAKLASIGELSSGVAHELNQPLMVVRNKTQLILRVMKKHPLRKDEFERQLAAIERNTKRMMNIINHLRTFSRQSSLDFSPVDINQVIENAFLMMGEQLRLHGIIVKMKLTANLPKIEGDANQLEQVILNLVVNARDAVAAAENKPRRRIEMITRISDGVKGAIEILITDTGNGIPQECLEKIFDPFFTTKKVGEGTGLGLSISYGIVKDHKGEIEAAETGPDGTTFRIELPIASNEKLENRKKRSVQHPTPLHKTGGFHE